MLLKNQALFLIMTVTLFSCATTKKSITLGLLTGAGTGAILGSTMSSDRDKGAMTGLAIGAVVGAIASYFVDDSLQKRDQDTRRDTLFNLEKNGVFGDVSSKSTSTSTEFPYGLSAPVVDEQFIDTHVEEGTKLIEGHRIWSIEEGSKWNPKSTRKK
jgi:hypothetical protein